MVIQVLAIGLAIASWYSVADNGTVTASGIPFSDHKNTCAHRTYPFGTMVQVINTRNGKTTYCTVTDRGPYVKGRVIDLSRVGAQQIGIVETGLAPVKVAVVPPSASPGDHPPLSLLVEKSPKQSRSKVSRGHGKTRSQGQRLRPKTKPQDAWQVTLRNLRST
jgi:rare lipoprotein A